MKKVYFIGEYGYCFRQLLPFLENYNEILEIVTWNSVCKIIDLLWKDKYKTKNALDFLTDVKGEDRASTFFVDDKKSKILEEQGYKKINLLDTDKNYFYDGGFLKFPVLKRKILYGEQQVDKPYVSIFPRYRLRRPDKNNITQEHIDWLKQKYPDKEIVGHGLPEERIQFDIRYCGDIYEQINIFNNSEVLICPASGLADLALMCGCNLILTYNYPTIERVNPHNCNISYWNGVKK